MKDINQCTDQIVEIVKLSYGNLSLPEVRQYKENMIPERFQQEFGTVKISLQRQVGHTTAALQLLNAFPNSLVFVPRGGMRQHFENRYFDMYYSDIMEKAPRDFLRDRVWYTDIERFEDFLINQKYVASKMYDLAIIDNASQYRPLEKLALYSLLGEHTKLFVELQ